MVKESISEIESKIKVFLEESKNKAKFEIVIRKDIYPEVTIKMGNSIFYNRDFFKGPLKFGLLGGEIQMFAV